MVFYSERDQESFLNELKDLGIQDVDIESEEEYWKTIQGHLNPYGKEFYDYVKSHKNIKFSKDPIIAKEEMSQIIYKMYVYPNDNLKIFPCEKSTGRLILEIALDVLSNL